MSAPEVSHGRGGAGNINPDETKYVDGEVVRVGVAGSHGDGAFSTGRGGKDVEHLPLPPTPSQSLRPVSGPDPGISSPQAQVVWCSWPDLIIKHGSFKAHPLHAKSSALISSIRPAQGRPSGHIASRTPLEPREQQLTISPQVPPTSATRAPSRRCAPTRT